MDRLTVNFSSSMTGNTLTGVAHTMGEHTLYRGQYETFDVGAFDKALSHPGTDIRALFNHNPDMLLGRQSAGTLRVAREENTLSFSVDLPDTSYAQDLKALVARGDINQCSFGFVPGKFVMSRASDGTQIRTHTEVQALFDVSPCSIPQYDHGTNVQLNSKALAPESPKSQAAKARARVRSTHEDNR